MERPSPLLRNAKPRLKYFTNYVYFAILTFADKGSELFNRNISRDSYDRIPIDEIDTIGRSFRFYTGM